MDGTVAQLIEKEADIMTLDIRFKRLSDNATLPTKAHSSDSGFDIYAAEDIIVEPGATVVVKTDLSIVLPKGYDAYIKNRSGVSSKTKLRVVSPPIDEGYRGAIGVIIDNIAQPQYYFEDNTIYTESSTTVETLKGEQVVPMSKWFGQRYDLGTYLIRKGDRLAQLTIQPRPDTIAVEITGELEDSDRGENGFGSSGV